MNTSPSSTLPPSDPPTGRGGSSTSGYGEKPGDHIGPYKLLSIIGEGGMGIVWLAERREPMVQRVALKIIHPGMNSRDVIARFEQERQALAVMDHPNVAKVFDGGVTPPEMGARPYFVMEHVQGEPITAFCDRHTYTLRQRLELFIPVCEAVQHAHHKGIIHRDLKPSNILVTLRDGRAIPKVIDFGVAKAVSHTLTEKSIFTEQGRLIGTPEYMSPEQAEMGALDIDTRTDVYSLGVVLYELLTGVVPFDPKTLRSKGFDEIRRIIREVPPPTPSSQASGDPLGANANGERESERARRAANRRLKFADFGRTLRGDLELIPLKALRKDRQERYHTPVELAEDIAAYLEARPVKARPLGPWYQFSMLLKRNRFPVLIFVGGASFALLPLTWVIATASVSSEWLWLTASFGGMALSVLVGGLSIGWVVRCATGLHLSGVEVARYMLSRVLLVAGLAVVASLLAESLGDHAVRASNTTPSRRGWGLVELSCFLILFLGGISFVERYLRRAAARRWAISLPQAKRVELYSGLVVVGLCLTMVVIITCAASILRGVWPSVQYLSRPGLANISFEVSVHSGDSVPGRLVLSLTGLKRSELREWGNSFADGTLGPGSAIRKRMTDRTWTHPSDVGEGAPVRLSPTDDVWRRWREVGASTVVLLADRVNTDDSSECVAIFATSVTDPGAFQDSTCKLQLGKRDFKWLNPPDWVYADR